MISEVTHIENNITIGRRRRNSREKRDRERNKQVHLFLFSGYTEKDDGEEGGFHFNRVDLLVLPSCLFVTNDHLVKVFSWWFVGFFISIFGGGDTPENNPDGFELALTIYKTP